MTIQWFPGHMAKARRQIEERLKVIDVVVELVDARVPASSRNPMIDEIVGAKPHLLLLNKADLADPRATAAWIDWFAARGVSALPIDAQSGKGVER
ncbi:YlqF/YawG family GTPase, partial [Calditerricola satsumensis]